MTSGVLRILDANFNRAREALRVIEDYARFVLNDDQTCAAFKQLRHDLADATAPVAMSAILHRDTPGDVGTTTKTTAEMIRDDVSHVVTAAGKRLGEALRTIEEYLKTEHPPGAAKLESIRYRFYDLEQRIARTLGRPAGDIAKVRLYVLVTEQLCKNPWLEAAEQAILGGADCLQLREKHLEGAELLRRARELVALCRGHSVISIINDRPDIVVLSGADGVHVGQGDLPAVEARKVVGPDKLVGVSTHSIDQARQAVRDGADYIGVGPVFRSDTKPRDFLPGLDYARQAVQAGLPVPAVAIAGITAANVDEVLATGIKTVAVTAAVIGADDVRAAAGRLKKKLMAQAFPDSQVQSGDESGSVGQAFPSAAPHRQSFQEMVGQAFPSAAPHRQSFQEMVGQTFLSAQQEAEVHKRRRRLPHWTMAGATYFVTFRIHQGQFTADERMTILRHVNGGDGKFYRLLACVVMPDHAHAILEPLASYSLSGIMQGIKGVSSRLINRARGTTGHVWQDESFDRVIRDQAELEEKLGYIVNNPVKAGLVSDPWEYPALFVRSG